MYGEELRLALEANREDISSGVRAAERELIACEQRCVELRGLIARGRSALGVDEAPSAPRRTLNEAMKLVLLESGGHPMPAPAILGQVKSRDLYRTQTGAPVSLNQIHARVYHSPDVFERTPQGIRLRDSVERQG
jgi:hypothetical protein